MKYFLSRKFYRNIGIFSLTFLLLGLVPNTGFAESGAISVLGIQAVVNAGGDNQANLANSQAQQTAANAAAAAASAAGNTQAAAAATTQAQAAAVVVKSSTAAINAGASSCGLAIKQWGNCATAAVAAVALALLGLAGFLLGLIGSLFNWIVVISVFQFGSYFGNSTGLLTAWGILRDIGNIMLLFGFIFMGIVMILDLHTIDTRRAIPQLVIVAVLLNFSLFIAEAIIDVSNVLSASIYTQAGNAGCALNSPAATCANQGISALVINATGVNTIFSTANGFTGAVSAIGGDPTHQMIVYIGLTLFVSVTAVVLLAAAIMLIIRALVLVMVMVLAPLGFVAMVIPSLGSLGKQWRDLLISQAFFAPVYLLLLLVSLKIMEAVKTALIGTSGATLLQALGSPSATSGTIIIVFALIIGFMIAALMTAKRMGAIGADFATTVATRAVRGTMTAAVRIPGGVAYRHTAAPVANTVGRVYNSTIGGLRKQGGLIGGAAGLFDHAAGGAINNGVNAVKNVKVLGAQSYDEKKKADRDRDTATAHANEESTLHHQFTAGLAASKLPGGNTDGLERAIQRMPQADFEHLIGTLNKADQEAVAKVMSSDKLEKVLDSKDLDAQIKENIAHARFHDFEQAVANYENNPNPATFAGVKDIARKFSGKETKILSTHLSDLMARAAPITDDAGRVAAGGIAAGTGESIWSGDQLNDMSKNDAYTGSERRVINSKKPAEQLKAAINAGDATRITNLTNYIGKEIADIPPNLLNDPTLIDGLNVSHLTAIMGKNDLKDPAVKQAIMGRIRAKGLINPHDPQFLAVKKYLGAPQLGWWGVAPFP